MMPMPRIHMALQRKGRLMGSQIASMASSIRLISCCNVGSHWPSRTSAFRR